MLCELSVLFQAILVSTNRQWFVCGQICVTLAISNKIKILLILLFPHLYLSLGHSYGGTEDNYPHPEADFPGFLSAVDRENKKLPAVWDPISKRPAAWIDPHKLKKMKKGGCSVM